ncbi:hypothetical protein BGZ54_010341 [Gamsiella multidivaricata]|nr:hypothetical protein BGZ54_010341 [Gamsiella multidivaricata]
MERLKGEGVQDWLKQHLTSPWHGHQTVASELGNDIISNIRERWTQLDSSVRLGVLFSLISLKKAQQLQLKDSCQLLIDQALTDTDEWARLVSQMLKNYPSEGTLNFNVEQFADQTRLGPLVNELANHISRDGIKFHPKEFAYLNESVCKEGQGKDPKTKTYPPLTGPSLLKHFNLRDSHTSIHTDRAERLRKMAEQASPIVAMAAGNLSSVGGAGAAVSVGSEASGAANAGLGAVGGAASNSQGSGLPGGPPAPGPPRPTKSTSSGLFVSRKPAGSFLRSNAPRPMPLTRNPSVGQLPLRSPRLDGPTTPRSSQKMPRIQILDIQQGTEIIQSMNDAKIRKEQAEQREKELKKEQRAQEAEAKRQQEAEKKAQIQKEKEEKKKERDEAKKLKERQKHEREEQQYQQAQKGRERRRSETEQDNDQDPTRTLGGRGMSDRDGDDDEEEEEEASLSSQQQPRKRLRLSSSRRGSLDDDYDDERQDRVGGEPMSPVTPSLATRYSNHSVQDHGRSTPIAYSPTGVHANSYFPSEEEQQQQQQQGLQQQHHQPPSLPAEGNHDYSTIFQDTNLLTMEDREYITAFLEGHPVIRPNGNETSYQIIMNQEQVQDSTGRTMYELILIEMNFETGEWRKIKRRRLRPHAPVDASNSEAPQ